MKYEILLRRKGAKFAQCTVSVKDMQDAFDLAVGWLERSQWADALEVRDINGVIVHSYVVVDDK